MEAKTVSRKKKATLTIATLLILAIPVATYLTLKPQIFDTIDELLAKSRYTAETWKPLDTILTYTVLSYGVTLPLAALGIFHSNLTTPWAIFSTIMCTSSAVIAGPIIFLNRIIHTTAYPIAVYAVNTIRKLNPRKTALYLILIVLLIQPLSMLGTFPLPITIYAGERHGSFTDPLSPCVSEEK